MFGALERWIQGFEIYLKINSGVIMPKRFGLCRVVFILYDDQVGRFDAYGV
jgi:hypothetical protein